MALKARDLYASSNGDRWSLVRDAVNQEVCVKHEPNAASGGNPRTSQSENSCVTPHMAPSIPL